MFKTIKIAAAVAAVTGLTASPVLASSAFCEAQVASYRGELDAKVSPAVAEIDMGIADILKGKGDPDKVGLKMADGTFKTLPELRRMLLAQRAEVEKQIDDAAASCTKDLKPFQDATDTLVTSSTLGLSGLLPKHMTHVEIGEILAGKPFGGDGGLVPHFREQVLTAVGLSGNNGEIVKLIRDPVRTILKVFRL